MERRDKKRLDNIREGVRPVTYMEMVNAGMFTVLPKFSHKDNNNNYNFPIHLAE